VTATTRHIRLLPVDMSADEAPPDKAGEPEEEVEVAVTFKDLVSERRLWTTK